MAFSLLAFLNELGIKFFSFLFLFSISARFLLRIVCASCSNVASITFEFTFMKLELCRCVCVCVCATSNVFSACKASTCKYSKYFIYLNNTHMHTHKFLLRVSVWRFFFFTSFALKWKFFLPYILNRNSQEYLEISSYQFSSLSLWAIKIDQKTI